MERIIRGQKASARTFQGSLAREGEMRHNNINCMRVRNMQH